LFVADILGVFMPISNLYVTIFQKTLCPPDKGKELDSADILWIMWEGVFLSVRFIDTWTAFNPKKHLSCNLNLYVAMVAS